MGRRPCEEVRRGGGVKVDKVLGETAAAGTQPVMECRTVNTSLVSECMNRKAGGGVRGRGGGVRGLGAGCPASSFWHLDSSERSTSAAFHVCYITKPDETQ